MYLILVSQLRSTYYIVPWNQINKLAICFALFMGKGDGSSNGSSSSWNRWQWTLMCSNKGRKITARSSTLQTPQLVSKMTKKVKNGLYAGLSTTSVIFSINLWCFPENQQKLWFVVNFVTLLMIYCFCLKIAIYCRHRDIWVMSFTLLYNNFV